MAVLDVCFTEPRDDGCSSFGRSSSFQNTPVGFVHGFVRVCARTVQRVHVEIKRGMRAGPVCILGELRRPKPGRLLVLVEQLAEVAPKAARGTLPAGAISSDLWLASDLLGPEWEQAIELVRYQAEPEPLPLTSDGHSDYVVLVLAGSGFMHGSRGQRDIAGMKSEARPEPLHAGSMVLVTRGFPHRFVGHDGTMTLLVCHLPCIAYRDATVGCGRG